MALKNRDLTFIVKVQNQARAALTQLRGQLASVGAGGNQAARGMEQSSKASTQLQQRARAAAAAVNAQRESMLTFGNVLKGVGIALAVREAANLSDEYVNMQNKLAIVTAGEQERAVITQRLLDISNRTRTSMGATVDIYSKTAQASKVLGLSQNETLDFTERLNKAVILSGVSASAAEGALVQLSQGLASGTLQGDELRSVLEQLPYVAKVLAKEMGVAAPGALKKMASEGKLTAQDLVRAFSRIGKSAVEVDNDFKKTMPTISQSVMVARNQIMTLWGQFTTGTGLASGVAKAILFVANNLETLVKVAAAAAITFGTVLAVRGIGVLVLGLKSMVVSVRASWAEMVRLEFQLGATSVAAARASAALKMVQSNGKRALAAVGTAATFAATSVLLLTTNTKVSADSAATMGDVYAQMFGSLGDWIMSGVTALGDLAKKTEEGGANAKKTETNYRESFQNIAGFIDETNAVVTNFESLIDASVGMLVAKLNVWWNEVRNGIVDRWINPGLQSITDFVNTGIALVYGFVGGVVGGIRTIPAIFAAIFHNAMVAVADIVSKAVSGIVALLNFLPGIDITPTVDLKSVVGGYEEIPSIAEGAAAGARDAMSRAFKFTAPQVARSQSSGEEIANAMGDGLQSEWDRTMAMAKDNGVRGWVDRMFDAAEEEAKKKGGVDLNLDSPGLKNGNDKKGGKDKKDNAAEKLKKQLQDLMKEIFPAKARLDELAEKMALLNKIPMSEEDRAFALERLNETYGRASDAISKYMKNQRQELALAGLSGDAKDEAAEKQRLENEAVEDGLRLTDISTVVRIEEAMAIYRQTKALERLTAAREELDKKMRLMDTQASVLGKGKTDKEMERVRELEEYKLDLLEKQGLAGKATSEMTAEQLEQYRQITAMVDEYAAALGRVDEAQRKQNADAMAGLRNGIQKWADGAADVYSQMSDAAGNALGGMTDMLTEFVTTGKMNFGDFARSVIADIARIIVKMLLLKAISSIFGGFLGGGGGAAAGAGAGAGTPIVPTVWAHTGGMVGSSGLRSGTVSASLFANAKRLHTGGMVGLKKGERPVIALDTERVLNPQETRAYNAGQAAGMMGSVGRGGGGGNQIVLAPQFNNDFSGLAEKQGMSPDDAKRMSKALEDDTNIFMERWVQKEMRPGGRLAKRN